MFDMSVLAGILVITRMHFGPGRRPFDFIMKPRSSTDFSTADIFLVKVKLIVLSAT